MTVDEFLKGLYQQGVLSKQQVMRVREQIAKGKRPATLDSVARGLVSSGLATQVQIDNVLRPASPPPRQPDDLFVVDDSDDQVLDLLPVAPPPKRRKPAAEPPAPPIWEVASDPIGSQEPEIVELTDDLLSPTSPEEEESLGPAVPSGRRRKKNANPWESPLILWGGGGLLLLIIVGLGLYLFLVRGNGNDLLQVADGDYEAARYAPAVQTYEQFLKQYPGHPQESRARVWLGLARIRQLQLSTKDWVQTLHEATKTLPTIEAEEAFAEARSELVGLLPDIAKGIIDQALRTEDLAPKITLAEQAEQAIGLLENSNYIPSSQRKTIEGRVEAIQESLQVVRRDVERGNRLADAMKAMADAVAKRDPVAAYETRAQLVQHYPILADQPELMQATQAIANSELELIQPAKESAAAEASDIAYGSEYRVVFASESQKGSAPVSEQIHLIRLQGVVYALDAATGNLLWRRFVGLRSESGPWQIGATVVLWNSDAPGLIGVAATTGQFLWRLPVDEGPLDGTIAGETLLISHRTAGLWRIDPQHGSVLQAITFPRPISGAACTMVSDGQPWIAQAAEHSTIYLLDAKALAARGNLFTGHAAGTIQYAPLPLGADLLVPINATVTRGEVHIYRRGEGEGKWSMTHEPIPFVGRIVQALQLLDRRRVLLATDRGVLAVLGTAGEEATAKVQVLASTVPQDSEQGQPGFAAYFADRLWFGTTNLANYDVLPARGEIVRRDVLQQGHSFLAPFQIAWGHLLHISRAPGRAGAEVSAWTIDPGQAPRRQWISEIAVPRAGDLVPDPDHRRLLSVSLNGVVHAIQGDTIRQGIARAPLQQIELHPTAGVLGAVPSNLSQPQRCYVTDGTVPQVIRLNPAHESAPLEFLPLANLPGQVSGTAALWGNQILVPLRQGPITLVDVPQGKSTVTPFQPPQGLESEYAWLTPAPLSDTQFAVADATGRLFTLALQGNQLRLAHRADLSLRLTQGLVAKDNRIWVVGEGEKTQLIAVQGPDLSTVGQVDLPGAVIWGPHTVLDSAWVQSDDGQLIAVQRDMKEAWRLPLEEGALIGSPLSLGSRIIVATMSGVVLALDPMTGKVVDRREMHEPLASGCVPFQDRLYVAGSDGTLLILPKWPTGP